MQAIYKNKDKGGSNKETDPVGAIICARGIGRYMEREHIRELRRRVIRI